MKRASAGRCLRKGAGELKIARVFPRKTNATPLDPLVFVNCGPGLFPPQVDEVHVSVTFTWDRQRAEELAREWERVAPVRIGGPGMGHRGEAFTPGLYLKDGYTITSRGCPNNCWFCTVPKREGGLRELPIRPGWNVLDDNLLACSEAHVRAVFAMLRKQPRRVELTGGLEAARLRDWHVELIANLKPGQLFFAYDTPDDWEPLRVAAGKLNEAWPGYRHRTRAYVLIGWPQDTYAAAEERLQRTLSLGIVPMAMLWRGEDGARDPDWTQFQRAWARPARIRKKMLAIATGGTHGE